MNNRLKLFTPGPVDIWPEVLDSMGQPVDNPFADPNWVQYYFETLTLLKQVFQTRNDIILMTAPGSGGLEAGLASLFSRGEKILLLNNGTFANRLREIMSAYGYDIIQVEEEWGKAGSVDKMRRAFTEHPDIAGIAVVANETSTGVRNPVQQLAALARQHDVPIFVDAVSGMGGYSLPVDDWGLDVVCTSSNKALEMAPGLAMVSVSERAWEIIEAKKDDANRGWYLNLSVWREHVKNQDRPFLTTPAVSLIMGLRTSLQRIIENETLEGHWARMAWAQQVTRAGLRNIGCTMLVCDDDASPTITTFQMGPGMGTTLELRDYLVESHGILLSTAIGPLAENTLRFAHMGLASTKEYLLPCLMAIEAYVRSVKGLDVPVGASLVGLGDAEGWH